MIPLKFSLKLKLVLLAFVMSSFAWSQTLEFTINTASVNPQYQVTEVINNGGNVFELVAYHTSGVPELSNASSANDLAFNVESTPSTNGMWVFFLYKNNVPYYFQFESIDYFSLSSTSESFDIMNDNGQMVSVNQVTLPSATGTFNAINTLNAFTNTIIISSVNASADVDVLFHNIRLSVDCSATQSSISVEACENYLSPSGNYTYSQSGLYMDTLISSAGCDSIISIDLTINSIDNSVSEANGVITANANGLNYQWVDCDNGNSSIIGEVGQSFIPTISGNYAVELSNVNCTVMSDCIPVTVASLKEIKTVFTVAPNPANHFIIVSTELGSYNYCISDNSGRLLLKGYGEDKIDVSKLAPGKYFLTIENGLGRESFNILIAR